MPSSKAKTVAYWIFTAVVAFAVGPGALPDVLQAPDAVAYIGHLGYPTYFVTLIGIWKVLAAIAVLAPKFPRLKEWAYAGIFFDLSGAAISHVALGDAAMHVVIPLVLLSISLASWALRPQSRRLAAIVGTASTPQVAHGAMALAAHP